MRAPLVALALLSCAQPAMAEPRRFAIVMGANEGASTEPSLLFAEEDAQRFAALLSDLSDVNDEDIVLLRGASRAQLSRVVRSVSERVAAAGPGSLLFFYYSGHADASSLHLGRERLGFNELTETLERIPADVRVLVIDACRSGALTRLKGGVPAEPFEISVRDRLASEGTAIITSSSAGEDSQESDRLRGGVFTHHFLGGLAGAADVSGDGRVTLTEAYRYSYTQTIRSTSQARVIQHPSYSFELRGENDIVMTDLNAGEGTGSMRVERGGEFVLFEANRGGALIAEVQLPERGLLSVRGGDYVLRRRDASTVKEANVTVTVGQTVWVRDADLSLLPYGQTVRKGATLEQRGVWAVAASVGASGPLLSSQSSQGRLGLGLRHDGPQATFQLRTGWSRNLLPTVSPLPSSLSVTQDVLGLDGTLYKLYDRRHLTPGIGVRLGIDGVQQRFDSLGTAPTRRSLVFRGGSVLRVERSLNARTLIGLEWGADFIAYRSERLDGSGASLQSRVVPTIGLEVSHYAR